MSDLRRALVWGIAAGREGDLLALLPLVLPAPDPDSGEREPGVVLAPGGYRIHYHRVVGADGTSAWAVPARPSSGDGEGWHFYLVQPEDRLRAVAREFRERLLAWASANQPTGGGLYHMLGPFTPAAAQAQAPAEIWAAIVNSWWTIWSADSALVAEQQALGDADLEDDGE